MPAHSTASTPLVHRSPFHWVGVEIGPVVIRAAVYDGDFRYTGKVKLSTKLERGPEAVIERIARCVRYAADECDLRLEEIRAATLAVPGQVEPATGRVIAASLLKWENVGLCANVEKRISLPVFAENLYKLGTLGIHRVEMAGRAGTFAAFFPGARIGGALMADGVLCDVPAPAKTADEAAFWRENVLSLMPGEQFQYFRGKDFKKALRRGNAAVEQFVRELAARTGEVAAEVIQRFRPEAIAIGGGVIEEMKGDLMEIIQCTALRLAPAPAGERIQFVASALGDYAPLAGGAVWAAQQVAGASVAPKPELSRFPPRHEGQPDRGDEALRPGSVR